MTTQGGHDAAGMDLPPDFTTHDFVATNGAYGYGCAGLDGDFVKERVTTIRSAKQLPLSACRGDSRLPKP